MNNLKRVLSLGLVGTMLAGMMVMGASAADFTDAADIEHSEAVNILVALNVIDGKPDGSFDPQGNVSRAEMAKMIAVAMNGGSEANTGTKTTPSFTDIGGHWAESFIEYCADLGIISGRGDGTFAPDAQVTGLEATKMVLTAMGFDSEAYKLTGAQWAVRTDEVARTMTGTQTGEPNMYEDLGGVMMATTATRDTAAQLIWNGLQNRTRTVQPTTTSGGGVEWTYVTNTTSLLKQRYDANVWTGNYVGNSDTGATATDGEIVVGAASFPSDLGIENIGEEIKVVYKDGSRGTANRPDKNDTIYGAFNTGNTQVIWTTKNGMGNQKTSDPKLVADGATYNTTNTVRVYTDYASTSVAKSAINGSNAGDGTNSTLVNDLKTQSVDRIKFVCNEDGDIYAAYVTTVRTGRVTAVTSSRITISGVGVIDIDANDIYADPAKDDVVVYTRYYSDSDRDDAYFTVTKAETVEGELEGYKLDGSKYENIVVDGETYKVNGKPTAFTELSDDAMTSLATGDIGDTVRLYLADGMVVGIDKVESSGGTYAVITDADTSGTLGSNLNGWRVTIMTADGKEETYSVHKDSVSDGNDTTVTTGNVVKGALIDFSISGGQVKIEEIKAAAAVSGAQTIWDESARKLLYANDTDAVAASDAVVFMAVTDAEGKPDKFYTYNLRSLGDVSSTGLKVAAFVNDDGLVEAAYYENTKRPNGNTDATRYGIVASELGPRKVNDENYDRFTVAVGDGETLTVNVQNKSADMKKGAIVTFDETSDACYDMTDFTILDGTSTIAEDGLAVAVKSYSSGDRLLSYFLGTKWNGDTKIYEGCDADGNHVGEATSVTVARDVTIVYVDQDGDVYGSEAGISGFDTSNGYANAILYTTETGDNALVDVIIVETSGEKNVSNAELEAFAQDAPETWSVANIDTIGGTVTGTYTARVSTNSVSSDVGTFTLTITCTAAPTAAETLTLGGTGVSGSQTASFGTGDRDKVVTLTVTITGNATPTLTGAAD